MTDTRTSETCAALEKRLAECDTELARLRARSEAMGAITATALSTLDLEQMLHAVLAEIVSTIGASAATVMLLEDDDRLVATASVGLEEEVREGFSLRIGEGFAGRIAADRAPLYSPEVGEDALVLSPQLARRGVRSMLGVPLLAGGEIVGVLRVGWTEPHPLDALEVEILQLAADRFALAILNARLYATQARIADELQSAMLTMPDEVAGVEFSYLYRSATQGARVGGDFFDIFELPGQRVGIVIGDVSGHGLHTAALAAVARTTLKAYALEYPSPGQVLTRTNAVLFRESASNEFVTTFVAVLEADFGRLRYANAGHPPPFACDPTGCRVRFVEPQTLLGAFGDTRYEDSEARLAPGETMLLYTDGALEARSDSGAFYGPDRLHDALSRAASAPVGSIPAEVYRDLAEFTGGRLADDLALLAVRPRSPGATRVEDADGR